MYIRQYDFKSESIFCLSLFGICLMKTIMSVIEESKTTMEDKLALVEKSHFLVHHLRVYSNVTRIMGTKF